MRARPSARAAPALCAHALALLSLAGCEGVLRGDPVVTLSDAGPALDAPLPPGTDGGPRLDAGPPPPGTDAGPLMPDAPPADPCAGVTCGTGARCDPGTRACVCSPGFLDTGGACTPAPTGDPSTRSATDVCTQWRDGHVTNAAAAWTPGPTMCDPGSMSRDALDDTLRRIAMFRWLVGLPPVTDEAGRNARDQACAIMMYREGSISHTPGPSWACYTAEGAAGAGSSNLSIGTSDAADSIDLYVGDVGVEDSLGHRRWVLNDPLGVVGIGFAGNAGCLGVFDSSGSGSRPWTSWPNAGPAPVEATMDPFGRRVTWSFHSRSIGISGATATVTRVSDGAPLAVTSRVLPSGYGPDTLAFAPMGWTPAAGQTYRVSIAGTSAGTIDYEVDLVSCP